MNEHDTALFELFYDLQGIIDYKDNGNICEELYQKCHQSLENNTFSDINVQNKDGNTFLHIVFHYVKNIELALEYTNILLSKSANPFIKNHNQQNCFQYGRFETINTFWTRIDNIRIDDSFKTITKGFAPQLVDHIFKQCLDKNMATQNIEKCCEFLKENNLYNHSNLSKILIRNFQINLHEAIGFFSQQETTAAENTYFLKEILCDKNSPIGLNRKNNQQALLDYVENTHFEININFLDMLYSHKLPLDNIKDGNWKSTLFHKFAELVIESNTDLQQKYLVNNKEYSFTDFFEQNFTKSYFSYLKLNRDIPHKESMKKKVKM